MIQLIGICKEHKTLIILLSAAVLGVVIFGVALSNIGKETLEKQNIIESWVQQLPEDHFLNDKSWWYQKELSILQSKFKESAFSAGKITEKLVVKKMGKLSMLYQVYRLFSVHKTDYYLQNESEKELDEIVIRMGETVSLSLLRKEESLSFVLKKEDFEKVSMSNDKVVDWIFPKDYVMASIQDTSKAIIVENRIKGLQIGTTTLNLYIDNQLLKYKITIE